MIPLTGHDKVNSKHYLEKSRLNLNANGIYNTYLSVYLYLAILHIYITYIYISYRNYPELKTLLLKVSRHE